jgi:hypothetical protein
MRMASGLGLSRAGGFDTMEKMPKAAMINAIRIRGGNKPWFETGVKNCPYGDCCRKADCGKKR